AHEIDCEAPALVCLACADTSVCEYATYPCCVLMLLVPFSLILTSYSLILAAVVQMRSTEASEKAFAPAPHIWLWWDCFFWSCSIYLHETQILQVS
ncbi:Olfactory Receptor 2T12, partial [Manis pentadactyla]